MFQYKKYFTYPKIRKFNTHNHNYMIIVGIRYSVSKRMPVKVLKCNMCSTRIEQKI